MVLYHIGSLVKLCLGGVILRLVWKYIDPTLDPAMAFGFGFLGIFITARGSSFYLFFAVEKFLSEKNSEDCAKESYKMSLLFGIYILINISLFFLEQWTKLFGAILFIGFIGLQIFLSIPTETTQEEKREF